MERPERVLRRPILSGPVRPSSGNVTQPDVDRRPKDLCTTIPHPDHPGFSLKSENRNGTCLKIEPFAVFRREPQPCRREHAQHVPVTEKRHIARSGQRAVDDVASTRGDVLNRFTVWNTILEKVP